MQKLKQKQLGFLYSLRKEGQFCFNKVNNSQERMLDSKFIIIIFEAGLRKFAHLTSPKKFPEPVVQQLPGIT